LSEMGGGKESASCRLPQEPLSPPNTAPPAPNTAPPAPNTAPPAPSTAPPRKERGSVAAAAAAAAAAARATHIRQSPPRIRCRA